jgi:hypothetical protein
MSDTAFWICVVLAIAIDIAICYFIIKCATQKALREVVLFQLQEQTELLRTIAANTHALTKK